MDVVNVEHDANAGKLLPSNYLKPWKKEEYDILKEHLRDGKSYEEIAQLLSRTDGAIKSASERLIINMIKSGISNNEITLLMPRFDDKYINTLVEKTKAKIERAKKRKDERLEAKKREKEVKPLPLTPVEEPTAANYGMDTRILTDIIVRLGEIQNSINALREEFRSINMPNNTK